MILFALETLPLHYVGVPPQLKEVSQHAAACGGAVGLAGKWPPATLGFWHRRRLNHSCRLLGLPTPSPAMWQELEAIGLDLGSCATQPMIYSLRYFGYARAMRAWQQQEGRHIADLVHRGANWLLLRRDNPYLFGLEEPADNPVPSLPSWVYLQRVGLLTPNFLPTIAPVQGQPSEGDRLWAAKCHWQVAMTKQLKILQQQSVYAGCEDILRFSPCVAGRRPMLLEGMKSNFFTLRYVGQYLYLYTSRNASVSWPFLCGTTRNWLCRNAPRLPQCQLLLQDLTLSDMLQADGLLICNAAMGLRLVRELLLPNFHSPSLYGNSTHHVHYYHLSPCQPLYQLLSMYWASDF